MKKLILCIAAALLSYFVGGWNPAITFSKAVYKKDVRTCGSKNPGFTNFKRCFGNRWAWFVFVLDLFKAAAVEILFGLIFEKYYGAFTEGALLCGFFALMGHAFPVWYGFKGGKGFLVCLSTVWVADWRCGLLATAVLVVLLLSTKYMSFSSVSSLLVSPVLLLLFGGKLHCVAFLALQVLFVAFRHKENFKRLKNGTESKFYFKTH